MEACARVPPPAPPPARPSSPEESAPVYRPRHPERTALYRLLERHFEDYLRVHEERFEPRHGALRPGARRQVEAYLDCGRGTGGFARIRCPNCHAEHLLSFSCHTRNLCPSCQAKRSLLFGERLRREVLLDVPHRHVVFTIPRALRALFERERSLLSLLAQAAYATVLRLLRAAALRRDGVPGMVSSIQTFGSYANFHPHVHAIVTEGLLLADGSFVAVPWPAAPVLEEAFRRIVLGRLVQAQRLSEEFRDVLLSWQHSGFSVHAAERVEPGDGERLEALGRYATRVPLAQGAVRLREDGRVEVQTPEDPRTGATVLVLDALEFVHAALTQIPDPRRHLVRHQGGYANRVRRRLRAAREAARAAPAAPGVSPSSGPVTDPAAGAGPAGPEVGGAGGAGDGGERRGLEQPQRAGAATSAAGAPAPSPEPSSPSPPSSSVPSGSPSSSPPPSGSPSAPSSPPCDPRSSDAVPAEPGSAEALRRSTWARILRKVFEVEPLVCPRCGAEMVVVAWITKREVIDRILRHRKERRLASPFDSRAPPAA